MKLGEILLQRKMVSADQLEQAIAKQQNTKKKIGELLLEDGLISREILRKALLEQYWRHNGYWVID